MSLQECIEPKPYFRVIAALAIERCRVDLAGQQEGGDGVGPAFGDPRQREFYEYMKSYAPYENVRVQDYPVILITTGLNDPRVSYWEPAKWAAKLRATAGAINARSVRLTALSAAPAPRDWRIARRSAGP